MSPLELVQRGVGRVTLRRARPADAPAIAALVAEWVAEELLLPRTVAQIAAAVEDYFVVVDVRGRLLACAALREYSPSLAELVSVAVAPQAHGHGLGRRLVAQVERLARMRGHAAVFAHTLAPEFFEALGYAAVDRALYPEKQARAQTTCLQRALARADDAALAVAA